MRETLVGWLAAFCGTVLNLLQVRKCWATGSADDLFLKMFRIMALGVVLCVVFGVMKRDVMIIAANTISRFLLVSRLYFKLRRG